jgi:predicted Zn-ribbon and HTH transcriptional regulator
MPSAAGCAQCGHELSRYDIINTGVCPGCGANLLEDPDIREALAAAADQARCGRCGRGLQAEDFRARECPQCTSSLDAPHAIEDNESWIA